MSELPNHLFQNIRLIEPAKKEKILAANEEGIIRQALDDCTWNKTAAAATLGISRSTLYEKLKKYKILSPDAAKQPLLLNL